MPLYNGMPNFNMDMFLAQIAKPATTAAQVSPTGQPPLIAAPQTSPPQQLLDSLVGYPQSVMYMPVPYGAPGQPYYPPHPVYAYGNVPFPPAVYQPAIVCPHAVKSTFSCTDSLSLGTAESLLVAPRADSCARSASD